MAAADGLLYHLVPAADWAAARASGQPYKPRTYEQVGRLWQLLCAA